jgi:hypothetical protein
MRTLGSLERLADLLLAQQGLGRLERLGDLLLAQQGQGSLERLGDQFDQFDLLLA